MRLMMQTALCACLLWAATAGIGGLTVYKGESGKEQDIVFALQAVQAEQSLNDVEEESSFHKIQPLLAEPVSYAANQDIVGEQDKAKGIKATSADAAQAAKAGQAKMPVVYLTFDDGPSVHTKEVLAILKKAEVVGTFFVLGQQVEQYPAVARQILEEGHAIGNHTYNHVYSQLYGSFGEFAKQIIETDEAIYKATGTRTRLVRAPGGTYSNFDQGYFDALAAAGYLVHDWNVDSGDSKRKNVPAAEIISTVKGSKLGDKVVVLMHDSGGHAETVKALPSIISYYKGKGYAFAALTEQVEPIHFQTAKKLKWDRAKVTGSEKELITHYTQHRGQAEQVATKQKQADLIVHVGDKKLVFTSDEYTIRKGIAAVSLRKLTEGIGGRVEWDSKSGVVEADLGGNKLFWKSGEAGGSESGTPSQVMVSIRQTLAQFGITITDHIMTDSQREIWAS